MPTRTPHSKRASTARFSRPATSAGRSAGRRQATPARRQVRVTRRKPEPKGSAKIMQTLGGLVPGGGKAKGRRPSGGGRSKKGTAGLAVLAGAAGLAVKNRGKLSSMLPGRRSGAPPLEPKMPETPPKVQSNAEAGTSPPIADTDRPPT